MAWTANIAHWNDVGGMVPGSISNDATRDLPGGPAPPRSEARLRGHADRVGHGDHEDATAGCPTTSRATCGPGSPRRASASGASSSWSSKYGLDTFLTALDALHGLWRAGVARARSQELPKGRYSPRRGAGQRHGLHRDGRDQRRRVRRRPERQPRPGRRAEQRQPRRLDGRGADGVHEHHGQAQGSRTPGTSDR